MNKQELIDYCNAIKENKSQIINCIDVNRIIKKIEQLDESQKVTVPQYVADWIKYCKNTLLSLTRALMVNEIDFYNYANQEDHSRLITFLESEINQRIFARAWLDGYEVEQEKRYTVKIIKTDQYLYSIDNDFSFVTYVRPDDNPHNCHTRKELEEAGFGEVFNSPLFEVVEVQDDSKI